jgi:hypothetical protein
MAEDRSLDDFAPADDDGDGSAEPGSDDAEGDAGDAAGTDDVEGDADDAAGTDDAVDAADAPDVDGQSDVAPAVATSTWHADGAECDRCGERVERRWREADAFVCADCASW